MPSDIEAAWAAGFYDGEGCSSLFGSSQKPRCYVRLHLGQDGRQLDDLQRFQRAMGVGSIRNENRKGKEYYSWTVQSRMTVAQAMNILHPNIGRSKREQYDRCVEEARANLAPKDNPTT